MPNIEIKTFFFGNKNNFLFRVELSNFLADRTDKHVMSRVKG